VLFNIHILFHSCLTHLRGGACKQIPSTRFKQIALIISCSLKSFLCVVYSLFNIHILFHNCWSHLRGVASAILYEIFEDNTEHSIQTNVLNYIMFFKVISLCCNNIHILFHNCLSHLRGVASAIWDEIFEDNTEHSIQTNVLNYIMFFKVISLWVFLVFFLL
jgi:hypothetical protein